jgi:hypothetical protein
MSERFYAPGDFWRVCDVCGFDYRASETRKRWDGLITCEADWEPRHPQDYVRGRVDRQNVPEPRPQPVEIVIGPLTTTISAAASAGATIISVESSVRFGGGDHIGVGLDDGEIVRHVVLSVPDASSLTLTTSLRGSVSAGNAIINYSAVSAPDIG